MSDKTEKIKPVVIHLPKVGYDIRVTSIDINKEDSNYLEIEYDILVDDVTKIDDGTKLMIEQETGDVVVKALENHLTNK